MSVIRDAMQAVMKKAVALAPDSFIPGGSPDPLIHHKHGLIGAPVSRIQAITTEEIRRIAQKYFLQPSVTVVVRPTESPAGVD